MFGRNIFLWRWDWTLWTWLHESVQHLIESSCMVTVRVWRVALCISIPIKTCFQKPCSVKCLLCARSLIFLGFLYHSLVFVAQLLLPFLTVFHFSLLLVNEQTSKWNFLHRIVVIAISLPESVIRVTAMATKCCLQNRLLLSNLSQSASNVENSHVTTLTQTKLRIDDR